MSTESPLSRSRRSPAQAMPAVSIVLLFLFCAPFALSVITASSAGSVSNLSLFPERERSGAEAKSVLPPPPNSCHAPRGKTHTLHGWSVEPAKLAGTGFGSSAVVLGRFVLVMGGVTVHAVPSDPQGTPNSEAAANGGVSDLALVDLLDHHTSRAINLFDFNKNTARVAKDATAFLQSTADTPVQQLVNATLQQPAIGASSAVRVGSAAYVLGFCNTIPSFVDRSRVVPPTGPQAASSAFQRVRDYLLSVQRIYLADATEDDRTLEKEEDRSSLVHVSTHALPSSAMLRYNATCVANTEAVSTTLGATSATASEGDAHHQVTATRRIIYIIGGVNLATGEELSTVAQYDVDTGAFVDAVWSLGKPLATPGAVSQSELIFVDGGYRHVTDAAEGTGGTNESRGGLAVYGELSVLDTANGVFRRRLLPFADPRVQRHDGRQGGSKREKGHGELSGLPAAFGWTAPSVFVHGRTMVIAGMRGDTLDSYSSMLVWDDMAARTAPIPFPQLFNNGEKRTSGVNRHSERPPFSPSVQAASLNPMPHNARERGSMELHVNLLAPQRRDATLVAVPLNGRLKIFLLGGLMPPAAAAPPAISDDIFSATIAPTDESSVVEVTGVAYEVLDGTPAEDVSRDEPAKNRAILATNDPANVINNRYIYQTVGNASTQTLGYDSLLYNTTFRVLLSGNVTAVCPGVDGKGGATGTATSSACSLMLSASPNCDAPVAVLRNLGPANTRRETIRQVVEKRKTFFSGDAFRASEQVEETLLDVFSVGDVHLTGSCQNGLQHAYFTDGDDGAWAYKQISSATAPNNVEDGIGSASSLAPPQTHLYICLSTFSGTVAGCNAPDGRIPPPPPGGDPIGTRDHGDRASQFSGEKGLVNTTKTMESRGVGKGERSLPAVAWPPTHRRHVGSRSPERLPPPHYFVRGQTTFCQSSFYVALNGAAPFLLQGNNSDMSTKSENSAAVSISTIFWFIVEIGLLTVSALSAIYVYRERFLRDPDYLLQCIDRGANVDDTNGGDDDDGDELGDEENTINFRCRRLNTSATPQLRSVGRHRGGDRSWASRMLDRLGGVTPEAPSNQVNVLIEDGNGEAVTGDEAWQRQRVPPREVRGRSRRIKGARYQQLPVLSNGSSDNLPLADGSIANEGDGPDAARATIHPKGTTAATAESNREGEAVAGKPNQQNTTTPIAADAAGEHRLATRARKEKKTVLNGNYKVLRRLGRGSFSVVYLVKRVSDGKRFALKYVQCSDDVGRREAMKECEVAYALQGHPNVIQLVDMFMSYKFDSHLHGGEGEVEGGAVMVQRVGSSSSSDGDNKSEQAGRKKKAGAPRGFLQGERYLSLVMAYHEEGDLGHYTRQQKQQRPNARIPEATVVSIAFQVLSALKFMHQREPPIVHRDLKPENLLLTRKIQYQNVGESFLPVVLTDFGLSRVMDKTFCETGVGSLPYVAPECWQRHYSCKVDIWALGCILYAVMSRRVEADNVRVMFSECCRPDFRSSLMVEMVEELGYSEKLAKLVVRLLEMDPAQRPTAEEALRCIATTRPSSHQNKTARCPDGAVGEESDLLSFFDEEANGSDDERANGSVGVPVARGSSERAGPAEIGQPTTEASGGGSTKALDGRLPKTTLSSPLLSQSSSDKADGAGESSTGGGDGGTERDTSRGSSERWGSVPPRPAMAHVDFGNTADIQNHSCLNGATGSFTSGSQLQSSPAVVGDTAVRQRKRNEMDSGKSASVL